MLFSYFVGLDPSIPDHESIGTTEDMDHHSTDDEGTITEEHISPTVTSKYYYKNTPIQYTEIFFSAVKIENFTRKI